MIPDAAVVPGLPELVAGVVLTVLVVYVLMGGADFGGGVWDLLATGPRAERQRATIAHAIGPIWEANHVWMIVAVVLLFTAFPAAFSAIMTGLHIPITLMLLGIVLRGSSFVFRKVDDASEGEASRWQLVFAVSSLITPVMIGVVLGTLATSALDVRDGIVHGGFLRPWLQPFAWAVGALTLALFAWLAAAYLTLETDDPDLRGDFRRRTLGAGLAVAVTGLVVVGLARSAAPAILGFFVGGGWGSVIPVGGALAWGASMLGAWRAMPGLARGGAVVATVLVIVGWGAGQYPWLVPGSITIREAAAPDVTLRLVLWILGGGALVLVPAFAYLYVTFKGRILFPRD